MLSVLSLESPAGTTGVCVGVLEGDHDGPDVGMTGTLVGPIVGGKGIFDGPGVGVTGSLVGPIVGGTGIFDGPGVGATTGENDGWLVAVQLGTGTFKRNAPCVSVPLTSTLAVK